MGGRGSLFGSGVLLLWRRGAPARQLRRVAVIVVGDVKFCILRLEERGGGKSAVAVRLQRTSRGAHTGGGRAAVTTVHAPPAAAHPPVDHTVIVYVDEIRASAGNEYCILV